MKEKIFAILRTGKFKDSEGKEHTFTEQDLDEIAEKYNSGKEDAPIVVGHPKTNSPAFGWVDSLKRIGDKLLAVPKQLNEDFSELVKKGTYKKISVSLYPDKRLRHVGFLGGAAPAVKGLPAVEFSEEENQSYEFEGAKFEPDNPGKKQPADFSAFKETLAGMQKEIEKFAEALNSPDANHSEFSERLERLEKENQRLRTDIKKAEFSEYLDERIDKGNLTPAQKGKALELYEFVSSVESFDFSEKGKENPEKIFRDFLETLPKQIDLAEFTGADNSPSERDIALAEIRKSIN